MIEIYAMALFPLEEEKTFRENLRKISGERREKIRNFLMPVPPIEEQHRIVERLEALLPLCEDLKEA